MHLAGKKALRIGSKVYSGLTARARTVVLPNFIIELLSELSAWVSSFIWVDKELSVAAQIRARLWNLKFGYALVYLGKHVVIDKPHRVTFGCRTTVRNSSVIMPGNGRFVLGDGSHIAHNSVMAATGTIVIGKNCGISSGVKIYTVTYDRSDGLPLSQSKFSKAKVMIGDEVHIGANATILPGVSIGDHAVIGAGAVVTKNVAPHTVVIGVPAKPIDKLSVNRNL